MSRVLSSAILATEKSHWSQLLGELMERMQLRKSRANKLSANRDGSVGGGTAGTYFLPEGWQRRQGRGGETGGTKQSRAARCPGTDIDAASASSPILADQATWSRPRAGPTCPQDQGQEGGAETGPCRPRPPHPGLLSLHPADATPGLCHLCSLRPGARQRKYTRALKWTPAETKVADFVYLLINAFFLL